ncbi:histone-lysine N-methyltransferase SETD2-like isoform X2 [Xenia sp. Carnegie-2017]|uniref:histone-lysine N-methyltransferase SETD2-like isoform X2 n=1 Tax=Xenia sp. Carnegie-2017 TaxID=2897299 RepID=UPI001F03A34F|nr:histone-lysine N-methyltransferase SETD2-like isoform X2 [Xenia sp. Carnegie-2017]
MDFSRSTVKDSETFPWDLENKSIQKEECSIKNYGVTTSTHTKDSFPLFETLYENIYLGNKKKRVNKEIRRMTCDCSYCPDEHNFVGCGEDCINRVLMIECNRRCPCGEFCSNRKFQIGQRIRVEVFKTEKKGWGLRTLEDVKEHQFIMEYCGEVMGYEEFEKRVETYDKENRQHYYFMTLKADEIIDATYKGNQSRFINHSCDPNCETQKWTVNGYLRIGFFSLRQIPAGTELTFDYKFQRYGKKAQVCYCESQNCLGVIGGEKHMPLKAIVSASSVRSSSPRRNRRRRLAEQFNDKPLELEIAQLLAGDKGLRTDNQALKLSQFMVRAETTSQRFLLLDALAATVDQNCLKNFVKYQGLSLLWSWMVDLGENSRKLQKKIVQVLKHLPVANLNQVKDTKVLKVIRKWAKQPSVSTAPEEETSSSDVDSRGLSPADALEDSSRRDAYITSSSEDLKAIAEVDTGNMDNLEKVKEMQNEDKGTSKENLLFVAKGLQECSSNNEFLNTESKKLFEVVPECDKTISTNSAIKTDGTNTVNEFKQFEQKIVELKPNRVKNRLKHIALYSKIFDRNSESSGEESSKYSEDEATLSDGESVIDIAADLLNQWSSLKEVYRIPKKSSHLMQRELVSTSDTMEGKVVDVSSKSRHVVNTVDIPKIDEDLFKKDEFLSKLFAQELSPSKALQGNASPSNSELFTSVSTRCPDTSVALSDGNKTSVNQRLQNVASAMNNEDHKVSLKKAKKNEDQLSTKEKEQPSWTKSSNFKEVDPGKTTSNTTPSIQTNPWNTQNPSSQTIFSITSTMGPPQYPAPHQNTTSQANLEQQTGYQTTWNNLVNGRTTHSGFNQLPPPPPVQKTQNPPPSTYNQGYQIQTTPFGYHQTASQNHAYNQAVLNWANTNNSTSHPYPSGYPSQFPMNPANFANILPNMSNIQSIQYNSREQISRSNVAMVTSTASNSEWAAYDAYDKTQEMPLPPDWKRAYDGEGRAYYYHIVTRQTQWEPPISDRSPPTPELGFLGDQLDSRIDPNFFTSHIAEDVNMEVVDTRKSKKPRSPSTPPGSPPKSPMRKCAAADTTDIRKGAYSPSSLLQGRHLTCEQRKRRETFRVKLSNVVVNYLNPYHKVDCKIGRITCVEDFKFLARKLTHGVMVKELGRLKDESTLACNDSVKIKTKEYIRNYMQKFGPVFKPS